MLRHKGLTRGRDTLNFHPTLWYRELSGITITRRSKDALRGPPNYLNERASVVIIWYFCNCSTIWCLNSNIITGTCQGFSWLLLSHVLYIPLQQLERSTDCVYSHHCYSYTPQVHNLLYTEWQACQGLSWLFSYYLWVCVEILADRPQTLIT